MLKSIASRTIATLITVVSRIDMIAPRRTTPATIQVSRSSVSGAEADREAGAFVTPGLAAG
ncbi:MAG TPA: hypothetical protein VHI77_05525 [Solirubrobacterales bacterium]|nr:hypothetical protein [Solirubrobacterales bacterium]